MNQPTSLQPAVAAQDDDGERFGIPKAGWRRRLYVIVFEADTVAGRRFDVLLIWAIVASVCVVVLDSVGPIRSRFGEAFKIAEWTFTLLFSAEYLARLWCVRRPLVYARSFFGIIDMIAVLPTYLAFFLPGLSALIDVRILRLLRIFRVLKMGAYVAELQSLGSALRASRRKILVFLMFVLLVVLLMGTLMYVVEGPANGFSSIPVGIYWAIVTMTTVGFGDITPQTHLGRFIASLQMLIGWGILAVPTGIVSAEFAAQRGRLPTTRTCDECLSEGHELTANYCSDCGAALLAAQLTKGS
ncbi:MAG: ion transporter [Ideonella sp.]